MEIAIAFLVGVLITLWLLVLFASAFYAGYVNGRVSKWDGVEELEIEGFLEMILRVLRGGVK